MKGKIPNTVMHSNGELLYHVYTAETDQEVKARFESKGGNTWMVFTWLNGEIMIESNEGFVGSNMD